MTTRVKMHSGEVALALARARSDGAVTKQERQTLQAVAAGKAPWGPPANAEAKRAQAVVGKHAEAVLFLEKLKLKVSPAAPPGISIKLSPFVETPHNNPLEPADISRYPAAREGYARPVMIKRTGTGPFGTNNAFFREAGRVTLSIAGKDVAVGWKKDDLKEEFINRLGIAMARARLGFQGSDGSFYITPPK